jgi:hypothetical protein
VGQWEERTVKLDGRNTTFYKALAVGSEMWVMRNTDETE